MKLEIVYLPPGDLKPYEKNTRRHNPDDIEQIKESIRQDGFADPIGIWGKDNIIVEGHGRQIAALEMGLDEVPCIRLDHMTDDQRRDYAIRHNRTAELSSWDFSNLEQELAQLSIEGHDFDGLGFTFGENEGGSFEDFFTAVPTAKQEEEPAPVQESKKSEPIKIQCPHCKEWFTP